MPVKSKEVLESENSALTDELKNLKLNFATLSEENETLKSKINSDEGKKKKKL